MSGVAISLGGVTIFSLGIWLTRCKPRVAAACLWSLAATFLGSVILFRFFGADPYTSSLWIWLFAPSIWVGLQFWAYWTDRPLRTAVLQATFAILAALKFIVIIAE